MCGRFVGFRPIEVLRQYFPIDRTAAEATANADSPARRKKRYKHPESVESLRIRHRNGDLDQD